MNSKKTTFYNHIKLNELPYCGKVRTWLTERYGEAQTDAIWRKTQAAYAAYLTDLPDYGGKKNGHMRPWRTSEAFS